MVSCFLNGYYSDSDWNEDSRDRLWERLGKWSIYIYLLHFQVIMICKHLIRIDNSIWGSLLILAVALAFAAVVMTIRKIIRRHRTPYSR